MYVQIIYCYKPTNPNLNDIKQNFIRLIDFASQEFSQSSTSQHLRLLFISVQFSSITQSCPTLCDPMNSSMPGLPVHHQLPELTQTHVHWVGDAINHLILCRPLLLLSLSFPASGSFPMSQLFAGQSIGVSASTSVLPINTQDWSPLGWTGWIPL